MSKEKLWGRTGALAIPPTGGYPVGEGPLGTYTLDRWTSMLYNDTWQGGEVAGLGYIEEATIVTGAYTIFLYWYSLDDWKEVGWVVCRIAKFEIPF